LGPILLPHHLIARGESVETHVEIVAGNGSADYAAELTGSGIEA
jgi:hypothetical protein